MADHDNGYKLLFSHAEMVADLLRGFIREEWVRHLDFSTLEKVGASYVSDHLRNRESDVVWRLRWRGSGQWVYVYILLEFQSTVDPFMAVRVMTYVALLYQDLIRQKLFTPSGKLPPVLPVVMYNGNPPWGAALDVADLVEALPGGLERYRPRLSCSPIVCWTRPGYPILSWSRCGMWRRLCSGWRKAGGRKISSGSSRHLSGGCKTRARCGGLSRLGSSRFSSRPGCQA